MNRNPQEFATLIISVMKGKTQIYDDKQELIKRKPERGRLR